jgi:hypothetical protein
MDNWKHIITAFVVTIIYCNNIVGENTFLDIGIFYLVSVAEYITGGWIKTSKA